MKPATVVADTSPLIALAVMDLLPVLPMFFNTVLVPSAVVSECLHDLSKAMAAEISAALSSRLLVEQSVANQEYCVLLAQILDPGEAETIALAKEKNAIALIDEAAARKVAARENIEFAGSLSVLIRAKQENLIPAAAPLLNRLLEHGYHLDKSLFQYVVDTCGESEMSPEEVRRMRGSGWEGDLDEMRASRRT